jgi:electron transport complex protein RnfB
VPQRNPRLTRRDVLRAAGRGAGLLGLGGLLGYAARAAGDERTVWQLDPDKCIECGNCATYCVLQPSAVKCVHAYAICGYCDLCTGYLNPGFTERDTGAENQLCPTGAIQRTFVEDPYYEYTIDEGLCIGCAKCVKGCGQFGNGSLFLQVRHDRCLNCNECAIAVACPADAFTRVPAGEPYLLKPRPRPEGEAS